MSITDVTKQLATFLIHQKVLFKVGSIRILVLIEFLCFKKPQLLPACLHWEFFLTEALLFHKHADSLITGASDISQVSTKPLI